MHSTAKPVTYDVIEVAAEVVRVMYTDGIPASLATMDVITRKGLSYERSLEIVALAEQSVRTNPQIRATLEGRRGRRIRLRHFTHASATAEALG